MSLMKHFWQSHAMPSQIIILLCPKLSFPIKTSPFSIINFYIIVPKKKSSFLWDILLVNISSPLGYLMLQVLCAVIVPEASNSRTTRFPSQKQRVISFPAGLCTRFRVRWFCKSQVQVAMVSPLWQEVSRLKPSYINAFFYRIVC